MKALRYRRLTSEELEPFRSRDWASWGTARDSFDLAGVSLHPPGHEEPIVFVWSFARAHDDDRGTRVFSHVPYPQTLGSEAEKAVRELQAFEGGYAGFLALLGSRASLLD